MRTYDIFLERMAVLIYVEKRPFCYRDFLSFEHNGREHHYTHGTIRNTFSKLGKAGQIERVYQSTQAFYTIKGVDVGKPITPNHGEDYLSYRQGRFLRFLDDLPMDKYSIHDIRLRFSAKSLWPILSSASTTPAFPAAASRLVRHVDFASNKDIILQDIDLKDHIIKTTVHKTDTVSVMVACSQTPIPIDILGLAKLTSGLIRVEERLQKVMLDYRALISNGNNPVPLTKNSANIPNHMSWIVTMWHFGQDSLNGYSGEMFEIPWKDGLDLFRIYSKKSRNNKAMRIRKERQEYPNKPLGEAFMDKMKEVADEDGGVTYC